MSLSKPERRQELDSELEQLVVLLQIQDYLYLEVTKKFMLNLLMT
jgi:hypothetical protein